MKYWAGKLLQCASANALTRYKNKFSYSIEAEEEVLGLASLKLILQPMVENAIYHGMEFMDGDGEIKIRAWKEGRGSFT